MSNPETREEEKAENLDPKNETDKRIEKAGPHMNEYLATIRPKEAQLHVYTPNKPPVETHPNDDTGYKTLESHRGTLSMPKKPAEKPAPPAKEKPAPPKEDLADRIIREKAEKVSKLPLWEKIKRFMDTTGYDRRMMLRELDEQGYGKKDKSAEKPKTDTTESVRPQQPAPQPAERPAPKKNILSF